MTVWLNRSDVRKALNIQPNNRFNSADNGVCVRVSVSVCARARACVSVFARAAYLCVCGCVCICVGGWVRGWLAG
jgi:hypothetical protein